MRMGGSGAGRRAASGALAVAVLWGPLAPYALADEAVLAAESRRRDKDEPRARAAEGGSTFAVEREPNRPRSVFWIPALSFFLPGFDQWWEGQTESAMVYTSLAVGGYAYSGGVAAANDMEHAKKVRQAQQEKNGNKNKTDDSLDQKDIATRKYTLGLLVAQGAGGFSAYHSFRTAVRTRKGHGQYDFLTHEETPLDLVQAPLDVRYILRKTTFIPLAIGAGLAYLQLHSDPPKGMQRDTFRDSDAFFTTTFSFNAGMHEEAMFRGWIMPVLRESWGSDFWSNTAQAGIFAAAHLNTNAVPLPQFMLGWYLGWLDQSSGWRIGEGIFIHAWWDVLAFATVYSYKLKDPNDPAARALRPVLWLPPFETHF